jgi:outer membrane protein TolC
VSEVEDALVRLQSAEARRGEWIGVLDSRQRVHAATTAREKVGMAARLEVEETHRALLQAQMSHTEVLREQVTAWIALYRALGGGWNAETPGPEPLQATR